MVDHIYNYYGVITGGQEQETFRDYMSKIGMGESDLSNIDLDSFSESSDAEPLPILVITADNTIAPKFSDISGGFYAADLDITSEFVDTDDTDDTNIIEYTI